MIDIFSAEEAVKETIKHPNNGDDIMLEHIFSEIKKVCSNGAYSVVISDWYFTQRVIDILKVAGYKLTLIRSIGGIEVRWGYNWKEDSE